MFPAWFHRFLILAIVARVSDATISNRSEDPDGDNPAGIKCNVTGNSATLGYSVERNPETNKTILKLQINDHYVVNVPSAGPTPIRFPNSTGSPLAEVEEKEITTENSVLELPKQIYDDSWSYDEYGLSPEIKEIILEEEKKRHDTQTEGRFNLIPNLKPFDWKTFCREATDTDDEHLAVPDGSFHPKFEVVPGVGVYRFHATPLEWKDAREACEKQGAQLAVINSEEEKETLREIHNRCPHLLDTHFNAYQYLGVHDQYSEGKWETTGGIPLEETGFVNWARGQPDNSHVLGENCLSLNRGGFFNDVPCWTKLPFTCEHA